MSHNNTEGNANGVSYRTAPRLYDSTDCVLLCKCNAVEGSAVNQRATEAEESTLLRFVTRKRLVKTLKRNSRCGELLPSKD
jgi:hypothetical protein